MEIVQTMNSDPGLAVGEFDVATHYIPCKKKVTLKTNKFKAFF